MSNTSHVHITMFTNISKQDDEPGQLAKKCFILHTSVAKSQEVTLFYCILSLLLISLMLPSFIIVCLVVPLLSLLVLLVYYLPFFVGLIISDLLILQLSDDQQAMISGPDVQEDWALTLW